MKKLWFNVPVFFLLAGLFLVSCQDDSTGFLAPADVDYEDVLDLRTDDVEAEYNEMDAEFLFTDNGLRGPCFSLVFPVSIVFPDSTTQTAGSLEELKDILKEWKANATPGEGRPHLQFPFDVETADGEIVTVESKDDLLALKKDCVRDNKRRAVRVCFDLVFPVTLELPNGDTLEIENREEMKAFIQRWARQHRGQKVRPRVQLPFDVETRDGEIITIASKDDLIAALEDCKG